MNIDFIVLVCFTNSLTKPLPSPRFADCGFPRWMPKHSCELNKTSYNVDALQTHTRLETYKPIALAKFNIPSFVRTAGELNADIITY
jgi:hypothetical protein